MTTPIQSIEEAISVSWVSAIVSRAGASFDIVHQDYGVDLTVRRVDSMGGKRMDMGGVFDCQLKATINWGKDDDYVVYDLSAETYNKLLWFLTQIGAKVAVLVNHSCSYRGYEYNCRPS